MFRFIAGVWMEMPVHLLKFFFSREGPFFWTFLDGVTVDNIREKGEDKDRWVIC